MSVEGVRVKFAESDAEILRCYPIMLQLRPHLKETEFVGRVRSQQTGGFHLAYASDPDGAPHAVTGFRILEILMQGVFLYVDDLVTDADDRSKGWGQLLFDWLVEYACAWMQYARTGFGCPAPRRSSVLSAQSHGYRELPFPSGALGAGLLFICFRRDQES